MLQYTVVVPTLVHHRATLSCLALSFYRSCTAHLSFTHAIKLITTTLMHGISKIPCRQVGNFFHGNNIVPCLMIYAIHQRNLIPYVCIFENVFFSFHFLINVHLSASAMSLTQLELSMSYGSLFLQQGVIFCFLVVWHYFATELSLFIFDSNLKFCRFCSIKAYKKVKHWSLLPNNKMFYTS